MSDEEKAISPACENERHFTTPGGCQRWWWSTKDQIALTCFCWCHEYVMVNSGPDVRQSA